MNNDDIDVLEHAAHLTGMKHEEVRAAFVDDDGVYEVLTHDGVTTWVDGHGRVLEPRTPRISVEVGAAAAGRLLDVLTDLSNTEGQEQEEGAGGQPSTPIDDVPEGSVAAVLEWVGDDATRAQAALEVEQAREQPRTSLLTALEKVVGS
ncbi:hypothetical protein [Allokutzneria albata]|uniref:Uncharacterized protein n=1 Tax=Allokutzneria albata TaxID=211114 RepID=A0A1H0DTX1_ALLAB|nr:hypothetical protein [Allokutzneria albata]SDN73687.1 hypothetical protein SAMN04489726_7997 [Allokutzneria albata]